jgi:hypothetical protein
VKQDGRREEWGERREEGGESRVGRFNRGVRWKGGVLGLEKR